MTHNSSLRPAALRFAVLLGLVFAASRLVSRAESRDGAALREPLGRPEPRRGAAQLQSVTLACVDDVMCDDEIRQSAYDAASDTYDFSAIFAPSAPYLGAADYTTANLETCLAGPEKGYHGDPRFNSPDELARDLRSAGVDLVSTANNHCLDMGWDGLNATLDALDACGLAHVGTYRSPQEKASPFIVDLRGIKVAFLNYTNITNEDPLPRSADYAVNLFSLTAIAAEARAARAQGADLVILLLHLGPDFSRTPDSGQRKITRQLVAAGVDVVIGGHPHVTQPIEEVTVKRDGRPYVGLVAYSLGNFLSNQRARYSDSGIILYLEIQKTAQGAAVRGVRYLPVWVQKHTVGDHACFRILPVHPSIPPASDLGLTAADLDRMQQVWQEMNAQLNDSAAGIAPVDIPPPTLAGGDVVPASGAHASTFRWRVQYGNTANLPPDEVDVAIWFPTLRRSYWYAMWADDPADADCRDGKWYAYTRTWLPAGAYAYRFAARRGADWAYWPTPPGQYAAGPAVGP